MKKLIFISFILFLTNSINAQEKQDTIQKQDIIQKSDTVLKIIERIVHVTVYNPTRGQCDKTPNITASGKKINMKNPYSHKWIAISWDLLKDFPFGTAVKIEGTLLYDGIYYVQDLMAKKWKNKIDILIGKNQKLISLKDIKLTKL